MDADYVDYVDVEKHWEKDCRSELQRALDDLDIARQMLAGDDCITSEFSKMYRCLMIEVINRVYARVETVVKEVESEANSSGR